MAQRRMLSKVFTEADSFLDLSLEAQAVYLHLNVNADDDGFVANPKSILRLMGAKKEYLNELIEAGFVISFDKVIVLVDWHVQNNVPAKKYHKTQYQAEFKQLVIDENCRYHQKNEAGRQQDDKMAPKRIPELGLGSELGLDSELGLGSELEQGLGKDSLKGKPTKNKEPGGSDDRLLKASDKELKDLIKRYGPTTNLFFGWLVRDMGIKISDELANRVRTLCKNMDPQGVN
ncbi:hypothetical protein [Liquorilactobacillus oeni]|uniref:DnaD domain-containing protein n=1 Tax=Liquorilactobacillus oeni DSM 19972 TaxID=1423777 RepID=A0A0R1MCC4_9LACO|nr:hypothetical protein [Liquorilactobacillus oeni]KRL05847.1 hypothetical protein FD46_GL000606 [Liquorilactobacillus oeni DSM 19972]